MQAVAEAVQIDGEIAETKVTCCDSICLVTGEQVALRLACVSTNHSCCRLNGTELYLLVSMYDT